MIPKLNKEYDYFDDGKISPTRHDKVIITELVRFHKIDKETLKLLLHSVRRSTLFCWHDWIYWTFGKATKMHRVCRKCYKKQQDRQIIPKHTPKWIKDMHYD